MKKFICVQCNKEFIVTNRRKKDYIQKFCNSGCYGLFQKDKPKKEKLTYGGLHSWVRGHYTKLNKCEHCGQNPGVNKRGSNKIQWANKSGEYKREREDWICLCHSCHSKYDLSKSRLKHLCDMSKKSVVLEKFKDRSRDNKGQYK